MFGTRFRYVETQKKYTENIIIKENTFRNVPLINRFAYASYSENWNDNEFLETLEMIPTTQLEDGNYLWFEVKGDSMSRNESPSIDERDMVLARELYKHHWQSLQLKRAKIWVICHSEKGLMIKEIVKQIGDTITCHSWNPAVPEFDLKLSECYQLFYVKELRKNF